MKLGFRYLLKIALLTILISAYCFSQKFLTVKAESSNNSGYIKVEWTISSEDGVDHYVIERKSGGNDNYYEVGVVSRGTFSFEDRKDLFRSADGKVFSYRISARDASDRILTEITSQSTVYYSTASVAKRTWGSIKAMFR